MSVKLFSVLTAGLLLQVGVCIANDNSCQPDMRVSRTICLYTDGFADVDLAEYIFGTVGTDIIPTERKPNNYPSYEGYALIEFVSEKNAISIFRKDDLYDIDLANFIRVKKYIPFYLTPNCRFFSSFDGAKRLLILKRDGDRKEISKCFIASSANLIAGGFRNAK